MNVFSEDISDTPMEYEFIEKEGIVKKVITLGQAIFLSTSFIGNQVGLRMFNPFPF